MGKNPDSKDTVSKTINTVGEFIDFVTCLSLDSKIIFRGQPCDKPLLPVVGRSIKRSRFFEKEEEIIETFKRQAIPYINFHIENDWQWLAIAQHNGVPTRLLDWSLNPLVALWFAVAYSVEKLEDRVVWALYYIEKEDRVDTKLCVNPFSIEKTFVYFPEHVFPYIQAQSGVFTVHHKIKNENAFFSLNNSKDSDIRLKKILIPKEFVTTIRGQLDRIGINSATLFPGLLGIKEKIIYDNKLFDDELI